jgi:protein TonB
MPALDLAPAGDAAMALLALDLPPAPLPALVMPRPPAPPAVIVADAPVSAGGGDRAATLIDTPDLDRFYPHIARRRQIEGRTLLRLRIGADGRVESVRLVASEPPGVFELAADPLARALRFVPAQHEGVAVASEQPFELRWRLR